jgi:hypothetical protein
MPSCSFPETLCFCLLDSPSFCPDNYELKTDSEFSCSVISLLFFISRSKLVPDFALTLHFIHLVITSVYSHAIPQNWLWWALQIASAGMMTSLGVWSCQYRELRPITFGGSSTAQNNTAVEGASEAGPSKGGDEEQGYGRRGRGRGRDGAGEYEMVGMKGDGTAA